MSLAKGFYLKRFPNGQWYASDTDRMYTYLGINTYLSEPDARLGIGSVIGRDTVLTERTTEAGQLDRRARLGVDTVLT